MRPNGWPLLRALAGAVFVWSGFVKLVEPRENFAAAIERFRVVGPEAAGLLSYIFPWAELLGGAYLALGLWTGAATLFLWALDSAFLVVLAQAKLRGIDAGECGCFGEGRSLPVRAMFAFDAAMWWAFAGLWWRRTAASAWGLDRVFSKGPSKPSRA